jgi:hypothetical protein
MKTERRGKRRSSGDHSKDAMGSGALVVEVGEADLAVVVAQLEQLIDLLRGRHDLLG